MRRVYNDPLKKPSFKQMLEYFGNYRRVLMVTGSEVTRIDWARLRRYLREQNQYRQVL